MWKIIKKLKRLMKIDSGSNSPRIEMSNVLIVSSSAKDLWEVKELVSSKYEDNIDEPIRLDNGDFAIVVKRK